MHFKAMYSSRQSVQEDVVYLYLQSENGAKQVPWEVLKFPNSNRNQKKVTPYGIEGSDQHWCK